MKLPAGLPSDDHYHQYCWNCRAQTTQPVVRHGREHYHCTTCRQTHDRSLVLDPTISWWLGPDRQYWHQTAAVFVRDPHGRFLFFDRLKYPFGLTIPAGHVNRDEPPLLAAARELFEETRLRAAHLRPIATDDIIGDSCRRGSDAHRWHTFLQVVPHTSGVHLSSEGHHPAWLTLGQALRRRPTFAVKYLIDRYAAALMH